MCVSHAKLRAKVHFFFDTYNFFGQKCYQFLQNATKNRLFLYLYSKKGSLIQERPFS